MNAVTMDKLVETQKASKSVAFRPFTADSLEKIKQRIATEKERAAEEAKRNEDAEAADATTTTSARTRRPATAAADRQSCFDNHIASWQNSVPLLLVVVVLVEPLFTTET